MMHVKSLQSLDILPLVWYGMGVRIGEYQLRCCPRPSIMVQNYEGVDSNPGKSMDVYKYTVPLQHGGGILNRHRTTNPLVRLMECEERREVPDHPQRVSCRSKFGRKRAKSYRHLHIAMSSLKDRD
ncbi:hypothetical protein TNCV_1678721 [Trichonephila clavipes]|nr:hypothetical protein TNCV_1678721 [Trichonephila clavipes]